MERDVIRKVPLVKPGEPGMIIEEAPTEEFAGYPSIGRRIPRRDTIFQV
ncbi:MAG: hypothetical protein H5T60_12005, partial [Anaerolineae bacterium]|nr:hypothetical protein [Anaerolineae bacterium]